ncbi:MAG: hypothetical protein A4E66_00709 [Syntrophus sp. PtaB.Bin001]|nr:MAG: hypothetical protein A4E66_00709 [Syntrophus sp. PtaB.Bin001]
MEPRLIEGLVADAQKGVRRAELGRAKAHHLVVQRFYFFRVLPVEGDAKVPERPFPVVFRRVTGKIAVAGHQPLNRPGHFFKIPFRDRPSGGNFPEAFGALITIIHQSQLQYVFQRRLQVLPTGFACSRKRNSRHIKTANNGSHAHRFHSQGAELNQDLFFRG